jgi:hypothetical protein
MIARLVTVRILRLATCILADEPQRIAVIGRRRPMTNALVTATRITGQGLRTVGRGLRRGVVAVCAAVAMIVIYGLGSVGTYGLGLAGISTLSLATTSTPATAQRWRRRRGRGVWIGRRRRRRGFRRRRRGPGIYFYIR